MKVELKVTPGKRNESYEFFIDEYFIDEVKPINSVAFVALPLNFREKRMPFEIDGAPVFSLAKAEVQDLVNKLGALGFKPE